MTTTARVTIAPGAYRLTGITSTTGQCDCCTRNLTQRVFAVAHKTTGGELTLGRRCAAKATGYAVTAVEREARIAARLAEIKHRTAIVATAYPHIAAAWAARDAACSRLRAAGRDTTSCYGDHTAIVGSTAVTEDRLWSGRDTTRFGNWRAYLDANL